MRDHDRGIGEHLAAGAVIPMIVAVDQVLDRLFVPFCELSFEPLRRGGIDGIGNDDPFRSDEKNRVMKVVLKAVQIALDVGNGTLWVLLCSHGSAY